MVEYFKISEELIKTHNHLIDLIAAINRMVGREDRPAKIKPSIQKCQQLNEKLENLATGKKSLVKSQYEATLTNFSSSTEEFEVNQQKWFQYIDEVEGTQTVPEAAANSKPEAVVVSDDPASQVWSM